MCYVPILQQFEDDLEIDKEKNYLVNEVEITY